MKSVIINKNDANQRLDKFIFKSFTSIPTSMVYKGIRKKRIKVNGKKTDVGYMLREGDKVELYINDEFFSSDDDKTSFLASTGNVNIIYEDENILLADKEKGISVHDDESKSANTLINQIKAYLYKKGEYDPKSENSFSPSLCNRIDKNTQGIVICAKNATALREMNEKIKERKIDKFYLCLVKGVMEKSEDTLKAYFVKDEKEKRVYVYKDNVKGSKTAITKYKVLKKGEITSLLEVKLLTGRTHQIRAHLAFIGHPLVGDGKYGKNEFNKKMNMKTQALYSYKLRFSFDEGDFLSYLDGKVFKVDNIPFIDNVI